MRFSFLYLLLVLLISSAAWSQPVPVEELLKKYPNYPYIHLERTQQASIQIKKNKLLITTHYHDRFLILSNNLNTARSRKIQTDSFTTVKNIKALHAVYTNGKHSVKKISDITLQSEHQDEVAFYNDDKYYKINFYEAKSGDIITIDYDVVFAQPRFFGAMFFSSYQPVLHAAYSVSLPKNKVQINYRAFNNQKLPLVFSVDSLSDITTYNWKCDSLETLTEEWNEPSYKHKSTFVLTNIESYLSKGGRVKIGGSLPNLYAWYYSLLCVVKDSNQTALKQITDSLVKDKTGDRQKLEAIFGWVQGKVSYLAYEDGMNGFVPRAASKIADQKFGDCKDMANLLVEMSKQANLPVYHAWIGTRDIPFQFTEFPSPSCANHMIAVYINKGDTIFLDATGKHQQFDVPTSMIRGKEALIGIDATKYLVSRVPDARKDFSLSKDSVIIRVVNGNKVEGTGYFQLTGYNKLRLYSLLEKKSYEKQKKLLKDVLEKGNNKFTLDSLSIEELSIEAPIKISYRFTIPDYAVQNAGHTMINLNFHKGFFDALNFSKRKYGVDFSYSSTHKLSVSLLLDPQQKIDFLPEKVEASSNQISFSSSYNSSSTQIQFNNEIELATPAIIAADFDACDKVVNRYKKNKSQLVSISPK